MPNMMEYYLAEADAKEISTHAEKDEPAKKGSEKLFDIKEVEIFKTGTHNGNKFTSEDLTEMAKNFELLKSENPDFSLPIKIGHDNAFGDGAPAAGWMTNIRKVGDKLFADLVDIPETIYKFIKNKGFRSRSVEIITNFKDRAGKVIGKVLSAIALLGMTMPAVNLRDAGRFLHGDTFNGEDHQKVTIEFSDEPENKKEEATDKMPEEEKKENKDEVKEEVEEKEEVESEEPAAKEEEEPKAEPEAKEEKLAKDEDSQLVAEFKKLGLDANPEKFIEHFKALHNKSKILDEQIAKNTKEEKERKDADLDEFCSKLISGNQIIPAERVQVYSILRNLDDKSIVETFNKEFDVTEKDTILNMFKCFLESLPDRGLLFSQAENKSIPANIRIEKWIKSNHGKNVDDLNSTEYAKYLNEFNQKYPDTLKIEEE